MKIVYQFRFYCDKNIFEKIMKVIEPAGKVCDNFEKMDDLDFIYIEYQDKIYKFNRYDSYFISKVEDVNELNPYKNFPDGENWSFLHITEIDDRFSNKKYYKIKKIKKNQEFIEILNDKIIEDLYNGNLVKN